MSKSKIENSSVILPISFLWSRNYLLLLSLKLKSPQNPAHDHIQIRDYRTTSPWLCQQTRRTLRQGYGEAYVYQYRTRCHRDRSMTSRIIHWQMSQWQIIDIMTYNSYSLQYYSFWKGKIGFGFLKHEDRDCFLDNANSHQALQLTVDSFQKWFFCGTYNNTSVH